MICLGCKELHAGGDLARSDAGISLALGDCRKSGTRHAWTKAKLVLDVPYVRSHGTYRVSPLTLAQAKEFVGSGIVISCLVSPITSQLMSLFLQVPLIHRKEQFFQFDAGDEALALIVLRPWPDPVKPSALIEGRDYEFCLMKRME
jgi:hypothetical protein